MTRREDWLDRLHHAVSIGTLVPFAYGVHDCVLWAAYCIDQMCDTTHVQRIGETFNYHDEDAANAVIMTGGGLAKLISEWLGGQEPISAKRAAPGDVVLARNEDGKPIVGIVLGHNIVVPGPTGVIAIPYSAGVLAWRV